MRNKFKFFAFFMAMAALTFSACSDDDDDKKVEFEASAMVGVWDIDAMTTTVTSSEGTDKDVQEPEVWMDFKEDGTGVASNEMAFTWSLSGSSLTLKFEGPEEGVSGPPMGGQFSFSFDDLAGFEEIVLSVKELDDSYLAVEYAGNYPGMSVTMLMELSR